MTHSVSPSDSRTPTTCTFMSGSVEPSPYLLVTTMEPEVQVRAGETPGGATGGAEGPSTAPLTPDLALWQALVAWQLAVTEGVDLAELPPEEVDPYASIDLGEDCRAFLLDYLPVAYPELTDLLATVAMQATRVALAERGQR